MRTATQPRARRARTANATATTTDNRYTALVSDSDFKTDSVYSTPGLSDTDSEISAVNHQEYQALLLKDCQILQDQLGYPRQEDSNDDSDDDEDTMIITPEALKALCSTPLTPLKEWNTVQVQQVKRSIIIGLVCVPLETHNNGHGYVMESKEYFQQRSGDPTAILPKTPVRPTESLATINRKTFCWKNSVYNSYMEVEHSTVLLLKEVFPNCLVGLEVMPGLLPPNLKSKKALAYIQKLAKDPRNDHDATLTLKQSASQVTHKLSTQGCTMTFQELESIQHKLAEAPGDATLSKLELTPNEIMQFVIKQIQQAGYFPHNIDHLDNSW